MDYLSVCSGIEAASVAWEPLGFTPVGFSEIEKFPCSVLAHHYPGVTNFGDMTNHREWGIEPGSVDILVGGTPCQSFSVAGLRGGLTDDRGNLALAYCRILQQIKPRWFVWENVPGVLSSNGGRDFGSILGAMAELGYGLSYRVLDAQFFGVPQRRRRVFVVGYLGDWRRTAEVLFEPGCLSGDSQKGKKARKDVAGTLASRTSAGGGLGTDFELSGGLQAVAGTVTSYHGNIRDAHDYTNQLVASTGNTSHCLNAGGMGRQDYETETLITHTLKGEGFDASEDGTGRGTPLVLAYRTAGDGNVYSSVNRTAPLTTNTDPSAQVLHEGKGVRRLTPRECERLQGFPDDYTLVPHRGKPAADGPRYKAIGNSMAVPVMRWIGERIQSFDNQF